MAKSEVLLIDYPGNCISVNHYLGRRRDGGYYVKQEARAFMTELGWMLKQCHLEDYKLPLAVTCFGYFKDERAAPDLHNLSKVILDSIEEVSGINDKFIRWQDGDREIDKRYKVPYLLIRIKESR